MRQSVLALALLLIAACTPRGDFVRLSDLSPDSAALASQAGVREAVFVGTSRATTASGYGFERGNATTFLRYDILVPFEREVGEVTWPRSAAHADPRTDFLTLADESFADAGAFRRALRTEMDRRNQRDVVVYVHGFNTTLAEGVYRVAQMHYDLKVPGVAVHYAWPSRGSALGYVHDRDSALYGRDGLEDLLTQIDGAGAGRVVLVAHSMGGALAMETLRQMAIRGGPGALAGIEGVILISPDLDVDVFRAQARAIGDLPQPFLIFGSRRDSVLGLSSRLAGMPDRLGNLKDLTQLGDLDVTYLETSAFDEGAGHFNLGSSPALIQLLGGIANVDAAFRAEAAARVGLLPGAVLTVRNATQVILAPVEGVVGGR
jgi:esterase/lipase superfamily enzyme